MKRERALHYHARRKARAAQSSAQRVPAVSRPSSRARIGLQAPRQGAACAALPAPARPSTSAAGPRSRGVPMVRPSTTGTKNRPGDERWDGWAGQKSIRGDDGGEGSSNGPEHERVLGLYNPAATGGSGYPDILDDGAVRASQVPRLRHASRALAKLDQIGVRINAASELGAVDGWGSATAVPSLMRDSSLLASNSTAGGVSVSAHASVNASTWTLGLRAGAGAGGDTSASASASADYGRPAQPVLSRPLLLGPKAAAMMGTGQPGGGSVAGPARPSTTTGVTAAKSNRSSCSQPFESFPHAQPQLQSQSQSLSQSQDVDRLAKPYLGHLQWQSRPGSERWRREPAAPSRPSTIHGGTRSTSTNLVVAGQRSQQSQSQASAMSWRGSRHVAILLQAQSLRSEGEYAEAQAAYSDVLQQLRGSTVDVPIALNSALVAAYTGRACCSSRLGQHRDAKSDCDRAIAIDPCSIEALTNRAVAALSAGAPLEALRDCTRVIGLLGPLPHGGNSIGAEARGHTSADASMVAGHPGVATTTRDAAVALALATAYNNRGLAHLSMPEITPAEYNAHEQEAKADGKDVVLDPGGHVARAVRDFSAALTAYAHVYGTGRGRGCVEALNNRANARLRLDDARGALGDSKQAMALDPSCEAAIANHELALQALTQPRANMRRRRSSVGYDEPIFARRRSGVVNHLGKLLGNSHLAQRRASAASMQSQSSSVFDAREGSRERSALHMAIGSGSLTAGQLMAHNHQHSMDSADELPNTLQLAHDLRNHKRRQLVAYFGAGAVAQSED